MKYIQVNKGTVKMLDYDILVKKFLGIRFRQFRERLGKTQQQLAMESGTRQSAISRIEQGKCPVPPALLDYLYGTYGINKRWLLDGIGTMFEVEYSYQCNTASYINDLNRQSA